MKPHLIVSCTLLVFLVSGCIRVSFNKPEREEMERYAKVNALYLEEASQPSYSLSEAFSVDSLLHEVRVHNPDILAAKKQWLAAILRIPQARFPDNPSVSVSLMKVPDLVRFDRTMAEDRMLSVSQAFPLFGKLPLSTKITVLDAQVYAMEYRRQEIEIINEAKKAYAELFMNYRENELVRQIILLLEEVVKIAEARYSLSQISQTELLKINLELARLRNEVENLEKDKGVKEARINLLANRPPDQTLGVPQLPENPGFENNLQQLYRDTLENHPELKMLSLMIERNKKEKLLAEKTNLPDFMAGITVRGLPAEIGPWDFMLSLTAPFWFWEKKKYRVEEAIANIDSALATYEAMKNRIFYEVKDLSARASIAQEKMVLLKKTMIPLIESSFEVSIASFRSGKGDIMMVLDNERLFIETKLEYFQNLVDLSMTLADLDRVTGKAR